MRYSSALVLSTLALGQSVAAANNHNRHASFHARRHVEVKRDPVDFNDKSLYENVDWTSVFGTEATATAAPEAKDSVAAPSDTPAATPASYSAPAKGSSSPSGSSDTGDDIVKRIIESAPRKERKVTSLGKNPKTPNGRLWIGDDSPYKFVFTNDANEESALFCWFTNIYKKDFEAQCLNKRQADISIGLKPGQSITLSAGKENGGACSVMHMGDELAFGGHIHNTFFEFTIPGTEVAGGKKGTGAYNVSKGTNLKGTSIEARGKKCASTMTNCNFTCKPGEPITDEDTCVVLELVGTSETCAPGHDDYFDATGGGCQMDQNSETVEVSLG